MLAKENKNKEKMKEMTERYGGHCERKKFLMENVKEEKGMTIMKKGKQKKTSTITIREVTVKKRKRRKKKKKKMKKSYSERR